jgi:hypothetical protein
MKILAVDADGLLFEDYRKIPNCEPLAHGLAFLERLRHVESVLVITRSDLTQFVLWAAPYSIERTWLINPEAPHDPVSAAQGFVGRQHSAISLYVTAFARDAYTAASWGIPTALFFSPEEDNRMAITKGPGWSKTGYEPVEDTPDTEEDAWR